MVAEGFQVNVAVLPSGGDPDNYIRKHGAAAYQEQLRLSQPYLEYLLDRSASHADLSTDEGRRGFLARMLTVAARIPDAAARDQFADRLAHKARITEEVVRAEIRRAAVHKQTDLAEVQRRVPSMGQIKVAERGLIWGLMHRADTAVAAMQDLESDDLDGLPTGEILRQAQSLHAWPSGSLPEALLQRLSTGEAAVVADIARQTGRRPTRPTVCAHSSASATTGSAPPCSGKSTAFKRRAPPHTKMKSLRSGSARNIFCIG